VKEVIENTQIEPRLLDLEITEGMLVENIASVAEKMWHLKEHQVRFSIDDFGTGYSSLRYLQHFPINQLKIDQSFVRDLSNDPNSHVIINTIVSMADHMNLSVLAEGVENPIEKNILEKIGCARYQGYYFSKPVTGDIATQYLCGQRFFPIRASRNLKLPSCAKCQLLCAFLRLTILWFFAIIYSRDFRMATVLVNTLLKTDSKCSFITYRLRFFVCFCPVLVSLVTSCKGL